MGEWVVRAACQQLKDWRRQGLNDLSIGINQMQFAPRLAVLLGFPSLM